MRLEKQRSGAASGIVNGLSGASCSADPNYLRHDPRHFGGSIELPLALARLGREVAHKGFVGIAEDIVALRAVLGEIKFGAAEDGDEIGEAIHHLLAATQLIGVVK